MKKEGGFSLLEVTVVLMVMTVVMGVAFTLMNNFQRTYRYEEYNAESQRNGRFAIARLVEIIRSAGTSPGSLTTVTPSNFILFPDGNGGPSIRIRSDLDGDGAFTRAVSLNSDVIVISEDVTIKLNDSNQILLIDNTGNAPAGRAQLVIAENIRSLSFSDPDPTGSRRQVVVNLVAMPSGIAQGDPRYREVSFSATIRLRNR